MSDRAMDSAYSKDTSTDARAGRRSPSLRIHQTIARDLGIAILSGFHKSGDLLEGEIEAAERIDASRTAYREAIRILTAKGMIESRPKVGTRVTPRSRWNLLDPEVLAWMFAEEPDPGFVKDLFELRGVIEPAAAGFAAERRSDQQLSQMASALEEMRDHGLMTEQGRAADQQFHRLILQAAGNDALASLAGSVGAAVSWTTAFKQRHQTLPRDPLPEHIAVFQAIMARNVEQARSAMTVLLTLALSDMGGMD